MRQNFTTFIALLCAAAALSACATTIAPERGRAGVGSAYAPLAYPEAYAAPLFERKTLTFSAPLAQMRLSSKFGLRAHPISGDEKLHAGVDLVAEAGTPVLATAGGVVTGAGTVGGYGNMVTLAHPGGYETRYAHLSAFARGLRVGDVAAQGAVIGYVGATGYVTGPHLHYELRVAGRPIDPLRVNDPRLASR